MRLAGGGETKRHPAETTRPRAASRRPAARARSRARSCSAPWRTSASRPSTTSQPARAPRRRAPSRCGRVGEVDHRLPRVRLDEQLVAHGRRVHDQVAAGRVRRPCRRAARRPACLPEGPEQGLRRTTCADQAGARRGDPGQDLAVGVEAEHAAVAEDERVDGVAVGLVARGDDRPLVRDRHVRTGEAERAQRMRRPRPDRSTSNAE